MLEQRESRKKNRKFKKNREEKLMKLENLKLSSCRPKSRPNSPFLSTSKDGVIRCSACEEEYRDPPTEEWIQC
ncbi:hypothetical protein TNCV_1741311 [Trichonephila clavipes]|uniref:Uncharacterized protein n=1 Tax=Trichonephila clavipes TaxID=2585209 RepID=A0A8X6RIG3_TRICX|nr:hypothetical protein TNCV_1741311 [Trichonephila clavipes]